MFAKIRSIVVLAGALCAAGAAVSAEPRTSATTRSDLVGAWRLVRIDLTTPSGAQSESDPFYGAGSVGILIYDPSGWFSVQIMGAHRASFEIPKARPEQVDPARQGAKAAALDSYYAYYGTWSFDAATSTVTHRAKGALYPAEHDAVYPQHVEVHGNTMTFTRSQGEGNAGAVQTKVWERTGTGSADRADLLLLHGRIITVDEKDEVAQALAVKGGRILAVGTDRDIEAMNGPQTKVIDLHGRAVTPGLIDSHAHFMDTGLSALFEIELSDAASIPEILARIAKRAAGAKPDEWIVGAGWDEGKLAEHRYPTAAELDRVSPRNPVWLENASGHYGVGNSLALAKANINASTPAPAAGVIVRDAQGNATGELKESAKDLVRGLIPPYGPEQRRQALEHMIAAGHAEGMTGFKDPDIPREDWDAYKALDARGGLTSYVCVLFQTPPTWEGALATLSLIQSAKKDIEGSKNTALTVCGAKIFMDGSAMARTAWLYESWSDSKDHGFPNLSPELYRKQVGLFIRSGVGIGTHAIGDRAIDTVVDAYAAALAANPRKDLRLSVIHAYLPTEHALQTLADLQKNFDAGYVETQSEFLWWLGQNYPVALGRQRTSHLIPLRTYLQRGIIWAGGSDSPVAPLPARYGLYASVARQMRNALPGESVFGTRESVDVHAALRSYTRWAARTLYREKDTGSLEPGKSADFAVWDRDPYSVPTAQLRDMVCEMTVFRGAVVYERSR